jgi:hypothetical protein
MTAHGAQAASDQRAWSFHTPLPPADVLARLDRAARRGRLPGFHPLTESGRFVIRELGGPFEYRLECHARAHGERTEIECHLRREWRMPLIYAAVIAFSIWPGVWLTDSLLKSYFPTRELYTYYWYLALAIIPTPWIWRGTERRSLAAARAHAQESADALRAALDTSA